MNVIVKIRAENTARLADMLHEELCNAMPAPCARYRQPESAHHDFYEMRAQNLVRELEPITGLANIIPVVKIVIGEID